MTEQEYLKGLKETTEYTGVHPVCCLVGYGEYDDVFCGSYECTYYKERTSA